MSLDDLRSIAGPPRPTPPGPLERPKKREPKPPKPIPARNTKRAAKARAEDFGPQAALCRRRGCLVLGCRERPCVPHHEHSRGAGGNDSSCVPLCWPHHDEAHRGQKTFEAKYGLDLEHEAAQLAAELARRATHDCEQHARLIEHEPSLTSRYRCTVCQYVLPDEQDEVRP